MDIKQIAVAGSLESSDIMITVTPSQDGITIELDSSVEKQFGKHIREVMTDILKNLKVNHVLVEAVDKGALDCTIQARMITAIHRAAGIEQYNWKEIDSWNV